MDVEIFQQAIDMKEMKHIMPHFSVKSNNTHCITKQNLIFINKFHISSTTQSYMNV